MCIGHPALGRSAKSCHLQIQNYLSCGRQWRHFFRHGCTYRSIQYINIMKRRCHKTHPGWNPTSFQEFLFCITDAKTDHWAQRNNSNKKLYICFVLLQSLPHQVMRGPTIILSRFTKEAYYFNIFLIFYVFLGNENPTRRM